MTYEAFLREEAALIDADGCSGVTNLFAICCLQHDLQFRFAKSAADAYRWKRFEVPDYWGAAKPVTFEQANEHFRNCHFRQSKLGYLNPVAWWRYAVVRRRKGRAAWDAHRKREQGEATA